MSPIKLGSLSCFYLRVFYHSSRMGNWDRRAVATAQQSKHLYKREDWSSDPWNPQTCWWAWQPMCYSSPERQKQRILSKLASETRLVGKLWIWLIDPASKDKVEEWSRKIPSNNIGLLSACTNICGLTCANEHTCKHTTYTNMWEEGQKGTWEILIYLVPAVDH